MGLTGMILTKETYIIHIGCAVVAAGVCYVSNSLTRIPDARPAKRKWDYLDLTVILATGLALVVFFYSGTFLNLPEFSGEGLKHFWHTFTKVFRAWFATGNEGHGHEKPWYYWLKLIGRYEWPILAGLIFCLFCQRFKNVSLRYLAIYGVGTLIAYSIVRYKTPWCVVSIIWPFLFIFGAAILAVPPSYKRVTQRASVVLLCVSLGWTISLNYFRCTTYTSDDWDSTKSVPQNIAHFFTTEPYVYVQTYNDVYKLTRPVLALAERDPIFYQLTGHIIRTSSYPLPWILDDFPNVGYYENKNIPPTLDADFLLVQADRIEEVEPKLHNSYYTEPLTIRPYQDTSKLYFDAKKFKGFFPGRSPDFTGKGSG
jgi:hypothetical protein